MGKRRGSGGTESDPGKAGAIAEESGEADGARASEKAAGGVGAACCKRLRAWFCFECAPREPCDGGGIRYREVRALVNYAVRHGVVRSDKDLDPVLQAAMDCKKNPDGAVVPPEILIAYGALCTQCAPVTGRSLMCTAQMRPVANQVGTATGLLLVIAVGVLVCSARGTEPVWASLVWGALGSCVYLLKRLTDSAAGGYFDCVKFQGWKTRVLLGGVLGFVVLEVFQWSDVIEFSENEDSARLVAHTAIPFLTGLMVRVVYGALEKVVDLGVRALNLGRDGARG